MNETPQEIRQKDFSVTRRGYDRAEVSSFLASVAADLASAEPESIRRKSFSVTRRGYDKAEVSSYLARVAYEIEQERAAGSSQPQAEVDPVFESPTPEASPEVTDTDLFGAVETAATEVSADEVEAAEPAVAEEGSASTPAAAESDANEDEANQAFVSAMNDASGDDPALADLESAADGPDSSGALSTASDIDSQPTVPGDVTVDTRGDLADLVESVPVADTRPNLPSLPPLPELPSMSPVPTPTNTGGSRMAFDDDGFQQAAAEITSLMRQAHESALRLRAQAENEVRAAVDATESELNERRRIQLEHLELQRAQVETQVTDARQTADTYASEAKAQADRYLGETRSEADAYAERQRSQADTDAKAATAEAETYARATCDNADDYDRRTRADADAYATRARSEAENASKRIVDEADKVAVEMRATAERERSDSSSELNGARAEADTVRRGAHDEADRILSAAREDALGRSSDVLERGRALVQSLAGLESDSRRRLVEAQQAINSALDATTVTQLPDAELNSRIEELSNELDDLAGSLNEDIEAG